MKLHKYLICSLLVLLPFKLNAREFLNTYMHINFVFMYSLEPFGDMIDHEYNSYSILDTETNKVVRPDHYDKAYGIILDITPLPSIVLRNEEHAVKFGIRIGYRFHSIEQRMLTVKEEYGGTLLKFDSWMAGFVVYYAPSIEPAILTSGEYSAKGGFTFFMLYGGLRKGEINAYPSMRDNNETPSGEYYTKIDGYKIDIGIGGEVSICNSINFGISLYYSKIIFTMDEKIYPTVGKSTSVNEFCFELSMGIPID